jgi:hypothetical protein
MIKRGASESLIQYSKRFRETYQSYKITANSGSPVDIAEEEQAMDFFHGLDNGRYTVFKMNMLNGWATGAFNPPDTINQIYMIAVTWVKTVNRNKKGRQRNKVQQW